MILVVAPDSPFRSEMHDRLTRSGARVVEVGSVGEARRSLGDFVDAVFLDRGLPDGDRLDLLPDIVSRCPGAAVVLHGDARPDVVVSSVGESDVEAAVGRLLAAAGASGSSPSAAGVMRAEAAAVRDEWMELCRWDPALPPDTRPSLPDTLINALSAAMERPQPLGWGLDPALEPAIADFAREAGLLDVALNQLVCLREAVRRRVIAALPAPQRDEATRRLDMLLDRMMVVAAEASAEQLLEQALTDTLTGLGNRRAFERDLERELARARRHGRPLSLVSIDLDRLKEVNDTQGHAAGDEHLRRMATALSAMSRREDMAYRVGGDEFVLLLVDAASVDPRTLLARLERAGAPPFSLGVASIPPDDPESLLALADSRLYESRRLRQPTVVPSQEVPPRIVRDRA